MVCVCKGHLLLCLDAAGHVSFLYKQELFAADSGFRRCTLEIQPFFELVASQIDTQGSRATNR